MLTSLILLQRKMEFFACICTSVEKLSLVIPCQKRLEEYILLSVGIGNYLCLDYDINISYNVTTSFFY